MEEISGFQDWEFLSPSDNEVDHQIADDAAIMPDYVSVNHGIRSPTPQFFPLTESVQSIPTLGSNPDESPYPGIQVQGEDLNETLSADPSVNFESGSPLEFEDSRGGVSDEGICDDPKVADPARQSGDDGIINLEKLPVIRGKKVGFVWWKLPVELLKFLALRVRPAWSITVAAALVGAFMLGRKLYSKKPKSRRIPLRVAVGDKVFIFHLNPQRLMVFTFHCR